MRREIRSGLQQISTQMNLSKSYERQINKYLVEVHKKYSIPVACIVFVLIGAPLGVMARHGGFAVGAGFSLFFFLVYWAGLIGGEELADRLIVSPFIAMWTPNLVVGFFGVMLTIRTVRERSTLEWGWISKLRRKKRDDETTEDDTNI
jgi:lipopolysaccharide export system permease protein